MLAALDEAGQAGRTPVIFTSSNGLALGSHGLLGKQNLYDPWNMHDLAAAPGEAGQRRRLSGLLRRALQELDDPVDFEAQPAVTAPVKENTAVPTAGLGRRRKANSRPPRAGRARAGGRA